MDPRDVQSTEDPAPPLIPQESSTALKRWVCSPHKKKVQLNKYSMQT